MTSYREWDLPALVRWADELATSVARWTACVDQKPNDRYYVGMLEQTTRELSKVRGTLERRGYDHGR